MLFLLSVLALLALLVMRKQSLVHSSFGNYLHEIMHCSNISVPCNTHLPCP